MRLKLAWLSFAFTTEYHISVVGVIIARQPEGPVISFVCDTQTTTLEDIKAPVYLLLSLWLFVRLRLMVESQRKQRAAVLVFVQLVVGYQK